MKKVIIESPFAGEIEKNIEYARAAVRHSVLRNEAPMASHLLFTQPGILLDNVPEERALGIKAGLAWRFSADIHAFYTDRGWSSGMLAALHQILNEGRLYTVEIRSLNGRNNVKLPATLQEEIEEGLKNRIVD